MNRRKKGRRRRGRRQRKRGNVEEQKEEQPPYIDSRDEDTYQDSTGEEEKNEAPSSGRASPLSLKEQGLTPKERKRKALSESKNKAKYLLSQTWGLEAAIQKEERRQRELLGSKKSRTVKATATGEINENVPLYMGNVVLVVTHATKYTIQTEKVEIVKIVVPGIPNLEIKKRAGKTGYHKVRYRKPTKKELLNQKERTTYDVRFVSDGYEERDVVRTRLLAF